MNLQRAKLSFIVNTFILFTWILHYHVIYPFSFTEILNSLIILKIYYILWFHFLYNFPALLLGFVHTCFHLSHCILIICLDACLPFKVMITLKTAFLSLYVGTLPLYMRRKQKLNKYLSNWVVFFIIFQFPSHFLWLCLVILLLN